MWGDVGRYGVPRPRTYRTTHGPEPTLGSVLWRYGTRRVPRRAHLRSESGMRGGAARGAGWDSGGDSGVDARQEMTARWERHTHTHTHKLTRHSAGSAATYPRAHSSGDVATLGGWGETGAHALTDAVKSAQRQAERGSGKNKRARERRPEGGAAGRGHLGVAPHHAKGELGEAAVRLAVHEGAVRHPA